ncbi:MAG: holin family protein [Desulfovibrio sp.]|jgi:hypothetical protein|nr:holin family protein [Desulfovibrio sp.]
MSDVMGVFGLFSTVIDKIFPDKAEADKAKLALLELEQKGELAVLDALKSQDAGQAEINRVEAASTNWFVSGWRPAFGWIGAAAFAWLFLGKPVVEMYCAIRGMEVKLPAIDADGLLYMVFGILGISGSRTFEKMKGCTRFN